MTSRINCIHGYYCQDLHRQGITYKISLNRVFRRRTNALKCRLDLLNSSLYLSIHLAEVESPALQLSLYRHISYEIEPVSLSVESVPV